MAPLIAALTWLGASGSTLGTQTCSGTSSALPPNPRMNRTKARFAAAEPGSRPSAALKLVPPVAAASTAKPARMKKKLSWLMAEYQIPAEETDARAAWSASSSTVDPSVMISHASRNDTESAAAGTSCMPTRKTGIAAQAVRLAAGPRAELMPNRHTIRPTAETTAMKSPPSRSGDRVRASIGSTVLRARLPRAPSSAAMPVASPVAARAALSSPTVWLRRAGRTSSAAVTARTARSSCRPRPASTRPASTRPTSTAVIGR